MRDFQKLDPTALKAFYYAAESLNFTKAAESAALTQSGISQHISKLETTLGVNLFLRANRKITLTEAGTKLKVFAESYLDQLDSLFEILSSEAQDLKGVVRYAMPGSCLMTSHFPQLLLKREKFLGINLDIRICHSDEVAEQLLSGEIDFGFVTKRIQHKEILSEEFAREEYVLVGNHEKSVRFDGISELKEKTFISYPGMEVLFTHWQAIYFSKGQMHNLQNFSICGKINSLSGAITMVTHGVGLGVFPRHCVEGHLSRKELFAFKGAPLKQNEHSIFIIQLASRFPSARVRKVLDSFWEMKL
ncbi:MAG: LysR family transcriptional regulator [Pseudomonadota bacterium]|nr:LysR family transcriptional regulator [Pseudomonadota bacterium]